MNFGSALVSRLLIAISIAALCGAAAAAIYYNFLKVNDFGAIIATTMGSIVAVQIQAWTEEGKATETSEHSRRIEMRARQLAVLRQMTAHRSDPVDANFVQAFNIVPVVFQGIR